MRVKAYDKGSLIDRIHILVGGCPEAQVFSAATAGILVERLLHFERISPADVVTITRRRFPNWKGSVRKVERMARAFKVAA